MSFPERKRILNWTELFPPKKKMVLNNITFFLSFFLFFFILLLLRNFEGDKTATRVNTVTDDRERMWLFLYAWTDPELKCTWIDLELSWTLKSYVYVTRTSGRLFYGEFSPLENRRFSQFTAYFVRFCYPWRQSIWNNTVIPRGVWRAETKESDELIRGVYQTCAAGV